MGRQVCPLCLCLSDLRSNGLKELAQELHAVEGNDFQKLVQPEGEFASLEESHGSSNMSDHLSGNSGVQIIMGQWWAKHTLVRTAWLHTLLACI